jgi:hypothetical protein
VCSSSERTLSGHSSASLLRFGADIPRLKVLAVDLPIPAWPVGVMMLRNRTLAPAVQLFVDCARGREADCWKANFTAEVARKTDLVARAS